MDTVAKAELAGQSRAKSVQEHIDELPMWSDGTKLPSAPMTGMQWLIWSLAAAGKFFEGFVVFMTGVALPLLSREFGIGRGRERTDHRRDPVRHPRRRGRPRGSVGPVRPQDHVLRGNGDLRRVPGGAGVRAELFSCRDLPVRHRTRARLRLPDGSHHYFREHPEQRARQTRARRFRLPGNRSPRRHRGRLFRPLDFARPPGLALDVRLGDHSRVAGHARPSLHRRERQLAACARSG